MNRTAGLLLAALLLGPPASLAAESSTPTGTKTDKLLLSEDFSGTDLPAKWQPGGQPKAFSIVEGALQGVCSADDHHGPAIGIPIEGKNLTIQFSVKFMKSGLVLFLVDGDSQYGGQAHLLRVALGDKFAALQQDRGSLESKKAQADEKAKAAKEKRKPTQPTKEQLADPKFYRTETLDRKTAVLGDGKWHQVRLEINGNEATAKIDDVELRAKGNVWDAHKSRLTFLVGLAGTMQFDNVKVWGY